MKLDVIIPGLSFANLVKHKKWTVIKYEGKKLLKIQKKINK